MKKNLVAVALLGLVSIANAAQYLPMGNGQEMEITGPGDIDPQIVECIGVSACTRMWTAGNQEAMELSHATTWEGSTDAIVTPYSPLNGIRVVFFRVKSGRNAYMLKFMCELKHINRKDPRVTACEQTMRTKLNSIKNLTPS